MEQLHPVQVLQAGLSKLSASDQEFARSLLGSRFLSEKQHYWIAKLASRVVAADRPAELVGNVSGIVDLVAAGRLHLKMPRVLFAVGDTVLRISVAGERSRVPGAINVTSADRGFENRTWYGRVTPAGEYRPSDRVGDDMQAAVLIALRALAADPAGVAAAYGRKFGVCCFCAAELSDSRSIAAGYGPVCADNYGLKAAWKAAIAAAV